MTKFFNILVTIAKINVNQIHATNHEVQATHHNDKYSIFKIKDTIIMFIY